jgi:hypothetical protein
MGARAWLKSLDVPSSPESVGLFAVSGLRALLARVPTYQHEPLEEGLPPGDEDSEDGVRPQVAPVF